ncbi:MAG TPA: CPBP family intramembrane glutamic endopeptidase [Candidatus Saccharimonadia bacterium]|nr:CPBP family intramembrane glutamic endopeptidase [Candidatus Saccharimonadia bacterium]
MHWPAWLQRRDRKLPEFLDVPWSIRDIVVFVVAWLGIQLIVIVALRLLGPFWIGARQFLTAASNGNVIASFVLDLLDAVAGFGVVALYLRHYKVGWNTVGWRKVNVLKAIKYLVAILVIFIVLSNVVLALVSFLVPAFNANQAQTNEFTGATASHPSIALIALVLLPPILEETIFRGFLFPALAKKWGVAWGAILSSAIFGIAHAQANISIYTFVLGLLLCFMYVRLKSIYPGMAVHMLNNYLAFLALSSK